MDTVIENIKDLAPFLIGVWLLVIICVIRGRQRFRNSFVLMIALMMTAFFACGLFGDYMGEAMIVVIVLTTTVILLVPLMLIINGFVMIRREGKSLPNLLSLFMGIAVGIGEVAYITNLFFVGTEHRTKWYAFIINLIGGSAMYFCLVFVSFLFYAIFIAYAPHRKNFDYIIVHGCGLIGGERVSKLLSQRIDKGIELYRKQTNKPIIIPSGGKGSDESVSEAHAMALYLMEHGIPSEHIIEEDKSPSTLTNLENSKKIIDERGGGKVALVSSNYHVYRCLALSKKVGLKCIGVGSWVAFYYFPSALIREFIAVFSEKRMLIWISAGWVLFTLIPSLVYFSLI